MDGEHVKVARQDQEIFNIAVGPTLGQCDPIYFAKAGVGGLIVPEGVSMSLIRWYGSFDGVNYYYINKEDGTNATTAIDPPQAAVIPAACSGFPYLKALGDQIGHIHVCLKG
jgi:hypothetical protein